jgi:hypothetical protein
MKYYSVFAQAYGQGNYGDCTYNSTSTQCATAAGGSTPGGSSGGGLANTGVALVGLLTIACLIVFVSLIVRAWRRKPISQEIQAIQEVDPEEEKRLSDRF